MADRARAAFFDVDETLITAKSMFDFLRYWLALGGDDGTAYQNAAESLFGMTRAGVDRTEVVRAYYRQFAGVPLARLTAAGEDWYAGYRHRPAAFVAATLAALVRHRAAGDAVVLVSGSFPVCLRPLAREVGADLVLCTEPVVAADGRLTGAVERPMIGAAKVDAVVATIAARGLAAADCYAYGDHASDLGMLCHVGHPVVVGDDPVLRAYAWERDWPVLPAGGGVPTSLVAAGE
jgi:HAD superfamily hydrolase (TIGR01490 family)